MTYLSKLNEGTIILIRKICKMVTLGTVNCGDWIPPVHLQFPLFFNFSINDETRARASSVSCI